MSDQKSYTCLDYDEDYYRCAVMRVYSVINNDPPPVIGARLAAIKKNYIKGVTTDLLCQIQKEHDLDLTVSSAKRILKATTGRCGNTKHLMQLFGTTGRQTDDRSDLYKTPPMEDQPKWKLISKEYKPAFQSLLKETNKRARVILDLIQNSFQIRAGSNPELGTIIFDESDFKRFHPRVIELCKYGVRRQVLNDQRDSFCDQINRLHQED